MVEAGDEVELTKNRIGIIRYKGMLHGKNGIYYGIELTKGKGRHSGLFKGRRYFMCAKNKGVFVDKKQILYKLEPKLTEEEQRKRKEEERQKRNKERIAASTNYHKIKTIPSDTIYCLNGYLRKLSSDHFIPTIVIYTSILYYYIPPKPKKSKRVIKSSWMPPQWAIDMLNDDDAMDMFKWNKPKRSKIPDASVYYSSWLPSCHKRLFGTTRYTPGQWAGNLINQ